ncbi:hypothetical protein V8C44DRAFT_343736 [Trichoderma aethiopicum]
MAQIMDKDIYAKVNSLFALSRDPELFDADLIAKNIPIIRYIAAEGHASRHLVYELAAVKEEAIERLFFESITLAFYCTETELEAMMEEMQGQGSASDVGDEARKMMDDETWRLEPNMEFGLEEVFVQKWFVGKRLASDGVKVDSSVGDGHNGGTD